MKFVFPGFSLSILLITAVCCSSTDTMRDKNQKTEMVEQEYQSLTAGSWLFPQIKGTLLSEWQEKGLNLQAGEIYQPDSSSLNRAMARIGINGELGGSGAFISKNGLILTSYQTAVQALSSGSNAGNNLLEEGFDSFTKSKEIPAEGYTLFIPLEQSEVTGEIQSNIPKGLDLREKNRYEQKIREDLIDRRKGDTDDLLVEIKDLWSGNRQFMFVYKIINDVRLVHAPPSAVGDYSKGDHYWQWPRYAGSYAFLRAYVSPDGHARTYNSGNVPYSPERYLGIDSTGVSKGDFTMVTGFPGSTFRMESSYAFNFYLNELNPVLIRSQHALLDALSLQAEQSTQQSLATAASRTSFKQSIKYYEFAQEGLEKYQIIEQKKEQEEAFKSWIKQDSSRNAKYQRVLGQLDQSYSIASQSGDLLYATFYPLNNNALLQIAGLYKPYLDYLQGSGNKNFSRQRKDSLLARHKTILNSVSLEAQKLMLKQMLLSITKIKEGNIPFFILERFVLPAPDSLKESIDRFVEEQEKQSIVFDVEKAKAFLNTSTATGERPMVELYKSLDEAYRFARKNYVTHIPYLRPAQRRYTDGMLAFNDDSLSYPDANATLRLSPGLVEGKEGTSFTTIENLITDNNLSSNTFFQKIDALATKKPEIKKLPVNFLSANDVTGGSWGSPVLNGTGEIVGITLDSNPAGIASDYLYNPGLSRAVNVDIRYILFLMKEFSKAGYLIEEFEFKN